MPSSNTFFKTYKEIIKKQGVEYSYINVGGEPFHALALAFMDNCKSGVYASDETLKNILVRFSLYFPDYNLNQIHVPPKERMRSLVNSPRKSEVMACLAYVLRQMAVDEILATPLAYPELFQGLSRDAFKDHIRSMNVAMPAHVFAAAVSRSLDVGVSLSFEDPDHELRSLERYGEYHFELALQVHGNSYLPKIKHRADFESIGQSHINQPVPVAPSTIGTMADILDLIANSHQELWHVFVQNRTRLTSMVDDKELNSKLLLELYITHIPDPRNAQFFADLEQTHVKQKGGAKEFPSLEKYMKRALIHSIASELALGALNEDQFFASLERPYRHSKP